MNKNWKKQSKSPLSSNFWKRWRSLALNQTWATADSAGRTSQQTTILALSPANVQAQLALFTTTAWRIGCPPRCRRKKLIAWLACIGSSSSAKSASKPIPTCSKSMETSTSWSMWLNQKVDISWSWNPCLLKRTPPELFTSLDFLMKSQISTWAEVTNQRSEWTISPFQDATLSSSTSQMDFTLRTTDQSLVPWFCWRNPSHSDPSTLQLCKLAEQSSHSLSETLPLRSNQTRKSKPHTMRSNLLKLTSTLEIRDPWPGNSQSHRKVAATAIIKAMKTTWMLINSDLAMFLRKARNTLYAVGVVCIHLHNILLNFNHFYQFNI